MIDSAFNDEWLNIMGLIVKLFSFLVVVGIAGLFVLKNPDGTPWLSLSDFTPDTNSITQSINDVIPETDDNARDLVPVYKWKDSQGNWQFSNVPPEGIATNEVLISTDANRGAAPVPSQNSGIIPESLKNGKAVLIGENEASPSFVTPDQIPTLINDAKDVQGLMDNRQQQLDSAIK